MNTKNKIEQCLKSAPKPPTPIGLLDKMQKDVTVGEVTVQQSALQRIFAPSGKRISAWRVAAAAVIAIAMLIPLSYGAAKVIRYFTTFEAEFKYGDNAGYKFSRTVSSTDDSIRNKEDARKAELEFYSLYKQGKAEEAQPGIWVATLSNGEEFAFGGDPESLGLSENEQKELLKKQLDEINELRKSGNYKRTFIKEIEKDGVKIRLYRETFTLSNGKVVTLTAGGES
jgi:hypothetical protein